jgi:transcriptional regulator with XRE-family HTH domain
MPAPTPAEDIAARIRAARAYANLTRRELAALAERPEITDRRLAQFEDPYGTAPNEDQLRALAHACRLPLSFFSIDFKQLDGDRWRDQANALMTLRDAVNSALTAFERPPTREAGSYDVKRSLSELHLELETTLAQPTDGRSLVSALDATARANPRAAIMEAYLRLEVELCQLLRSHGEPEAVGRLTVAELALLAGDLGLLPPDIPKVLERLAIVRNVIVHDWHELLSVDTALSYVALADAALNLLEHGSTECRLETGPR